MICWLPVLWPNKMMFPFGRNLRKYSTTRAISSTSSLSEANPHCLYADERVGSISDHEEGRADTTWGTKGTVRSPSKRPPRKMRVFFFAGEGSSG